jgi:hypothetical protein
VRANPRIDSRARGTFGSLREARCTSWAGRLAECKRRWAYVLQDAVPAAGALCGTDCSAVLDEEIRKAEPVHSGHRSHELNLYLVGIIRFRQAEPATKPIYVGVDGNASVRVVFKRSRIGIAEDTPGSVRSSAMVAGTSPPKSAKIF